MAVEGLRRFLIAPRIRSARADRAVRAELTRLGVDAVMALGGNPRDGENRHDGDNPVMTARIPVTMRTRVMPSRRQVPPAPS